MRFYTNVHEAYGGIDLHARSMSVCSFNRDGEIMLHRKMPTRGMAKKNVKFQSSAFKLLIYH